VVAFCACIADARAVAAVAGLFDGLVKFLPLFARLFLYRRATLFLLDLSMIRRMRRKRLPTVRLNIVMVTFQTFT
jgi:hypothetical protein